MGNKTVKNVTKGQGGKVPASIRTGLAAVQAQGQAMHHEAMADYGVVLSASNAGSANQRRQLGRLERQVMGDLGRNQASLRQLTRKARANQGAVRASQAQTVSRYGAALGGHVSEAYGQANATAAAGTQVAKGAQAAGRATTKLGKTVMGLAESEVVAQKASAQYSLNQALQQRNIIDNQTLATLEGQLYQTALQYNMQWELWKKQQDYALKAAKKSEYAEAEAAVDQLMNEGSDLAVQAADVQRAWKEEHPDEMLNVTDATATWAAENGYVGDDPQVQVFAATLRNIRNGTNAAEAYANAIRSLYSGAPKASQWLEPAITAGIGSINTAANEAFLAYIQEGGITGSQGVPPSGGPPRGGMRPAWNIDPFTGQPY
jgi:hypothetical protein